MISQIDEVISAEQITLVNRLSKELGMPVKNVWKFFYEKGKKQGYLTFTFGNETKYFLKFTFRKFLLEWNFDESDLDLNALWKNCFALNYNSIVKGLREKLQVDANSIKEIKTDTPFQLKCYLINANEPLLFTVRYSGRRWNFAEVNDALH